MEALRHFIISDIINNTKKTIKDTTLINSKYYYDNLPDTEIQHEEYKLQLKVDLELLSESSLFLIHKTILQKEGE